MVIFVNKSWLFSQAKCLRNSLFDDNALNINKLKQLQILTLNIINVFAELLSNVWLKIGDNLIEQENFTGAISVYEDLQIDLLYVNALDGKG